MARQGTGGSLIAIGSGYVMGDPSRTPYRAAKAGIVGLTKSVAMAGMEHGVRANVISPIAETRMTHASKLPFKAQPEDIAPMAVYLLSDRARETTGEVFSVSGKTIGIWDDPRERCAISCEDRWTQDAITDGLTELVAAGRWSPPPVPPLPDEAWPAAEPEV